MFINIKRLALVTAICGVVWLIFTFIVIEIPRMPARRHSDKASLGNRIQQLEQSVDKELKESMELLELLKEKLKETEKGSQDKKYQASSVKYQESAPVLPVLVIACDRVTVRRCLDKLVRYRPSIDIFPIIVSQDCNHNATYQVIRSFVSDGSGVTVVQQPDLRPVPLPRKAQKFQGYYRISRHYKFALSHVLDKLKHESVIIVEDDLDISEDFYEYFLGTYPLLKKDKTLWCISAWNDNGKKELIDPKHPELLHRTDFFPGLGWLLPAKVWRELKPKWPNAFFDDWLRDPQQTGGRSCIRPEISRTSTFGKEGVSKGMFFDLHLRFIKLSEWFVPFTQFDLTYLLKDSYDRRLSESIKRAQPLELDDVLSGRGDTTLSARISYSQQKQFAKIAHALGLMSDFRSGIPRTAYRGVVSCFYKNRRVYIVPSWSFTKYDPSWG